MKMINRGMERKWGWKDVIGLIVLIVLLASTAYSIYKLVVTPDDLYQQPEGNTRSDYVLMLSQCLLGLGLFGVLAYLEHNLIIRLPDYMYVLFYIFLFLAIFLGEIQDFYYLIPFWDVILHFFSASMLAALGFIIVNSLNLSRKSQVRLSPFFVAVFSFCFAVAAGALWEIIEFAFDGILGMNMQKFALPDKTLLTGLQALSDTMYDLICDVLGALLISAIWLRKNYKVRFR